MTNETMNHNCDPEKLVRLTEVLEIYGAQPSSWPEEERDGLRQLVEEDDNALKLHSEALAFETVLNQASGIGSLDSLKASILGEVSRTRYRDNVTVLPVRNNRMSNRPPTRTEFMQNIALLAASLVIGIYLGMSDSFSALYPYESQDSASIVSMIPEETDEEGWSSEEAHL